MLIRKSVLALASLMLASGTANAQESGKGALQSYSFVELQGGAQVTLTDAKKSELITPVGSFSIGHYFTPCIGARLHVNGWQAKSGYDAINSYYKWNYVTTNADLLFNLTNMVCGKSQSHFLNVILVGGIGLTTAWSNDEANTLARANTNLNMPLVWDDTRLSHNIRAGLRLETDVTKPLGVSLEVAANSLDDRFNSKMNNNDDWMITAQLGLSFRFGHKYKKAAPVVIPRPVEPEPVVEPEPEPVVEPAPEPVVEHAPKPVVVAEKKAPETLREEVFYKICSSSDNANAQYKRVAEYLQRNPDAKVKVTGYADKGTGNTQTNMKYSRQRAQNFKDKLVKEYNVDASRIVVDAKGDSVQPFSENDKNRCVIAIGPAE